MVTLTKVNSFIHYTLQLTIATDVASHFYASIQIYECIYTTFQVALHIYVRTFTSLTVPV